MEVVILSGLSGAGKTTLAKTLSGELMARVVNAGDVVVAALAARGVLPPTRADAGWLFLQMFGEDALGPMLFDAAGGRTRVIVDGLRLPSARQALLGRACRTLHLHLETADEERVRRMLLRDGRVSANGPADSYCRYLRRKADVVVTDSVIRTWRPSFDVGRSIHPSISPGGLVSVRCGRDAMRETAGLAA